MSTTTDPDVSINGNITDTFTTNGSTWMDDNPELEKQLWEEANALNDLIEHMEEKLETYRRQFKGIMLYLGIEDFETAKLPTEPQGSEHKEAEFANNLERVLAVMRETGKPMSVPEIHNRVQALLNAPLGSSTVSAVLSSHRHDLFRRVAQGVYALREKE